MMDNCCKEIQSLLSPFLDKELDPEQEQLVRAHLSQCAQCQREFESLEKTVLFVRSMEDIPIPLGFKTKLHDKLVCVSSKYEENVTGIKTCQYLLKAFRSNWFSLGVAAVLMVAFFSIFNPVIFPKFEPNTLSYRSNIQEQYSPKVEEEKKNTANNQIAKDKTIKQSENQAPPKQKIGQRETGHLEINHGSQWTNGDLEGDEGESENRVLDAENEKKENGEKSFSAAMSGIPEGDKQKSNNRNLSLGETEKQVVKTCNLEIETSDLQQSSSIILGIQSQNENITVRTLDRSSTASGEITIQITVPEENYSQILNQISDLGKVTSQTCSESNAASETKMMNMVEFNVRLKAVK
ncbi:MAG: zf-HC2 domain-containing protein [Bacillota bacterium]|jgi:uncharacterized membrane protein YhiD involved in acid resistance